MTENTMTLNQLSTATKLVNRAYREKGPRSYKRGMGALLNALVENDGATQRELVDILSWNRGELKDVVKKAARNGLVTFANTEEPHTYVVNLTEEGRKVAEHRCDAQDKTSQQIISCLTDEERRQLDVLTGKIIFALESEGMDAERSARRIGRRHRA